jgi:hypothetical protein
MALAVMCGSFLLMSSSFLSLVSLELEEDEAMLAIALEL